MTEIKVKDFKKFLQSLRAGLQSGMTSWGIGMLDGALELITTMERINNESK